MAPGEEREAWASLTRISESLYQGGISLGKKAHLAWSTGYVRSICTACTLSSVQIVYMVHIDKISKMPQSHQDKRRIYVCVCNWLDVYMWHCMSDLTVSLEHVAPNEKVINGNVSHYLKQVSSRHKVLLKSPLCSNMVSYSWRAQVWSAIFIHKSKDWFEPMFFFFSFFFFYSQNVWINSLKMKHITQLLLVFHS